MQQPVIDPAALRLYYLQQLGISVYVDKDADNDADNDVAAAASAVVPKAALPDTLAESSSGSSSGSIAEPVKPVADIRKALLDDSDAPQARAPAAAKPQKLAASTAAAPLDESATMAPFQLLLWVPEPKLAVALQIPALAKAVLQEAELKLLQNLLRWLRIGHAAEAPMLHFRWPLPGLPSADMQAAGRNLQVFLQQAAATQPWQRLLLLGQAPALCLELASAGSDPGFAVFATHSLAEMLAVPELKREVWRHLLPLQVQL